jgi:hypothetical protein
MLGRSAFWVGALSGQATKAPSGLERSASQAETNGGLLLTNAFGFAGACQIVFNCSELWVVV